MPPRKKTRLPSSTATESDVTPSNRAPTRANNISVSQGSMRQQKSAIEQFNQFLLASNITWPDVKIMFRAQHEATQSGAPMPPISLYWLLEEFVKYLFNYKSDRSRNDAGFLSLGTADNYLSQVLNSKQPTGYSKGS